MKIGLIGYGKMGRAIDRIARDQVVLRAHEPVSADQLQEADVLIDFSVGSAVLGNLEQVAQAGKPIVVGTTDWDLEQGRAIAEKTGLFYAPNFSIGVYQFTRLVEEAMRRLQGFEVGGYELHHSAKRDTPSGTGRELEKITGAKMASVRAGQIPGTHAVLFDGQYETIELVHRARSRMLFAEGALKAAQWMIGRTGFYTMEDLCAES